MKCTTKLGDSSPIFPKFNCYCDNPAMSIFRPILIIAANAATMSADVSLENQTTME